MLNAQRHRTATRSGPVKQGSVELSGLPPLADPSSPELTLSASPSAGPGAESMPAHSELDLPLENAPAGEGDDGVGVPNVAEPEQVPAQALSDLGLQEARDIEEAQSLPDNSNKDLEALADVVVEVTEASNDVNSSSQELPEQNGRADETSVMTLGPASPIKTSENDATPASGPEEGRDPEPSNGQAIQQADSADASTVDASAMSPSPSQRSLQHSAASPSSERIPSSGEDVEADFFVRLVNHRLQVWLCAQTLFNEVIKWSVLDEMPQYV